MKLSCAISFYEWARRYGTWGKPGVYKILDILQHAGVSRVYLRMRQSQSYYPSRIDDAGVHFDEENNIMMWHAKGWGDYKSDEYKWMNLAINFSEFDPTPLFIQRGRELGIEIYGWLEQVEGHSWGWPSGFSRRHPEFLTRNRDGLVCLGQLGWSHPEVIDFKLGILREIFEYGFDGVAVDLIKGGDHRIPRHDEKGAWFADYDEPAIRGFMEKTGRDPFTIPNDDPEWIQYRAEFMTEFLRRAWGLHQRLFPEIKYGVFCLSEGSVSWVRGPFDPIDPNTPELMKGGFTKRPTIPLPDPLVSRVQDQGTWDKEKLLDFAMTAIHMGGFGDADKTQKKEYISTFKKFCSRFKNTGHKGVFRTVATSMEDIERYIEFDAEAGADEVVLFQGLAIERRNGWGLIKKLTDRYGT